MNNLMVSFKRFLKNKNTVTILGIVIILVLLYVVYNMQINNAVEPMQIPVAKETIQPRTEITSDMVAIIDVPSIAVSDNVYTYKNGVVGKYTNVNSTIPKGSMFYTGSIVDKKELPDSEFDDVKEGDVVYRLPVNTETTYGNSILPGNTIDIYMKAVEDATGKVMVGKLVQNVEVLAVKDSQGNHVFDSSSSNRTSASLIFGVPTEIHNLLLKAKYLSSLGVELFPVPQGKTSGVDGEVNVTAAQLKAYVEAHTINVQIDELKEEKNEATDSAVGTNSGANTQTNGAQ